VLAASSHIFRQRNLKDFASGLLQQVVALLRLEQSMLLRLKGASMISGESQYEVLARIGEFGDAIDPALVAQLDEARHNRISKLHGDTYVGYFPNNSGKASLLVLQGVEEISDIDAQTATWLAMKASRSRSARFRATSTGPLRAGLDLP
jgi:hypothetical protein